MTAAEIGAIVSAAVSICGAVVAVIHQFQAADHATSASTSATRAETARLAVEDAVGNLTAAAKATGLVTGPAMTSSAKLAITNGDEKE
jgi:hypothetical protein